MAPQEFLFRKELKVTDIKQRLTLPSKHLENLPPVEDQHDTVEFPVSCPNKVYTFRCSKRQKGRYLKPVIQRGWSSVVRDCRLQVGDVLEFYVEPSDDQPTRYSIEVHRCVSRHQEPMGTTLVWQRIV